jgi:hypothetical protein
MGGCGWILGLGTEVMGADLITLTDSETSSIYTIFFADDVAIELDNGQWCFHILCSALRLLS